MQNTFLTCPKCGHSKEETMPENSCQYFYECESCGSVLKPQEGDCCVFCSYGNHPCPPVQEKHLKTQPWLKRALWLSIITVVYNFAEGVVSASFGASDKTLALFGFGIDSFGEVASGLGITHMVVRMQQNPVRKRDGFERTALRITGSVFYILAAGLVAGAIWAFYTAARPETTQVGIIISALSIATMYFLFRAKKDVGEKLNSTPIIADANCTKTCLYLSFILLASSLIYEWLHIPYIDAAGSLGIAWYAFKEGRESFQKATQKTLKEDDCCC